VDRYRRCEAVFFVIQKEGEMPQYTRNHPARAHMSADDQAMLIRTDRIEHPDLFYPENGDPCNMCDVVDDIKREERLAVECEGRRLRMGIR